MKVKRIPKSLDTVMLIGQVLLWINTLLKDIVFSLKEISSLGKARNKMYLFDQLLKFSIIGQ